jgi:hypothetical protein
LKKVFRLHFAISQKNIKKKRLPTLHEVYSLIGIKKQNIFYWQNNPVRTQTKRCFKQNAIYEAGKIFELSEKEIELLANKAGLSFCADIKFPEYFNKLISLYPGKKHELYDAAQVSERMYRYVKNGQFLTKETLLALAISLELKLDDIQVLLKKAGYILSRSLPNDMAIIWLIEHDERSNKKENYVSYINEILYSLEMPLLMTRDKF